MDEGLPDNFYNIDTLRGALVSEQPIRPAEHRRDRFGHRRSGLHPDLTTDFRDDLPEIDVPMLVLQGDADQVLPIDKTSGCPP